MAWFAAAAPALAGAASSTDQAGKAAAQQQPQSANVGGLAQSGIGKMLADIQSRTGFGQQGQQPQQPTTIGQLLAGASIQQPQFRSPLQQLLQQPMGMRY